jgi:hypothetical protein
MWQGAGSAAVSSGSSGQDGKTIGGGLAKPQWFGRQPPTAPCAMREALLEILGRFHLAVLGSVEASLDFTLGRALNLIELNLKLVQDRNSSIDLQERQGMLAAEVPVHGSVNTAPLVKEFRPILSSRPRNDGTLMNKVKV